MITVKVEGKTLFINGIEVDSSKLSCDTELLAEQLRTEFAEHNKMLDAAVEFEFMHGISVQRRNKEDWVVFRYGCCWNFFYQGFEWERQPSSRTDLYIAQTRRPFDVAWKKAIELLNEQ